MRGVATTGTQRPRVEAAARPGQTLKKAQPYERIELEVYPRVKRHGREDLKVRGGEARLVSGRTKRVC
jgi:hypothetical protein